MAGEFDINHFDLNRFSAFLDSELFLFIVSN